MYYLNEKLFSFFSLSKILKIIIILTLSININCFDTKRPSSSTAKVVSIEISPSAPFVALGDDQQFTATAHYSDGSTLDVTSTSIWTSTNTDVATISNSERNEGLAISIETGATKISATSGAISDSTNLSVTEAELVSISIGPDDESNARGSTLQYSATGTYTDSSTLDITKSVTWTSINPGIATISNSAGFEGLASAKVEGETKITATSGAISDSTNLAVGPAELVSIAVTPVGDSIARGTTLQYTAMGTYTDSSTLDITGSVTWDSINPVTATISNTVGSEGLATAQAVGVTKIIATSGAISDSTTLKVTEAELVSIDVTPVDGSIAKGTTLQYTVMGTYTDSSTLDITGSVTWASTNTVTATISNTVGSEGLATAQAVGATKITATSGAISDTTNLTVTIPELVSIAVTPVNNSIANGLTLQYTAIGTYTDSSTVNITTSVTWTSTNAGAATISNSNGFEGLASAQAIGVTQITATSGAISDSTNLTVTAPEIVSIFITPINNSIPDGATLQYTAIATYTDSSTADVTETATWSSTSPGVATISNIFGTNGLATTQAIGTTIIEAGIDGIYDSTNLTVTVAELETIIVTPVNDSIPDGQTLQYTATGTYTNFSTQDITTSVTWSSSNTGVATVSSSGLAASQNAGSTTITATLGAISGSGTLTVSAPVIVSITITPVNNTIGVGLNLQYIAMGTYSNSSTVDITNSVTWSSTNTAAATISNSSGFEGLAAGVAAGATKIHATLDAISDTTNLTVDLELVSIDILPGSRTIADTDTLQYAAIGTFADSSTSDITDLVTWSSSDTGVATISNSAGSEGLATGTPGAEGTTTIQATMDSVSDSVCLRVTNTTTWELEVTTTDVNQNMTIWFVDGPVNMTIYWGDCTMETATETEVNQYGAFHKEITHTYSSAGTYTLRLRGTASSISFQPAWERLTGILSVVQGIDGLTSFMSSFAWCTNLKGSIPAGLFDNAPQVNNFQSTFLGCSGLTGPIPAGLFDNHPQVTTFWATFMLCSGLTGPIPAGLFDNNTLVTNFQGTFSNCSGLTGPIPAGLFDNSPLVTYFVGTFYNCSGLTGPIPAGLFDNNTLVTHFSSTFYGCTGLTSISSRIIQ